MDHPWCLRSHWNRWNRHRPFGLPWFSSEKRLTSSDDDRLARYRSNPSRLGLLTIRRGKENVRTRR